MKRVAIIDDGIGGLDDGDRSPSSRIEADVYERTAQFAEVGAGITLWPNATRILLDLGVGGAIVARGRRFPESELRTASGALLARISVRAIEAHFDREPRRATRATPAGAASPPASRSNRRPKAGAAACDSGSSRSSATVCTGSRRATHPQARRWIRRSCSSFSTSWHSPIAQLIRSTPTEAILHNDIFDVAPFPPWSRGRIVLLGDSAHATTPNLGQGACMAIESAAALAEEVARSENVADAIRAYEARRQRRTRKITEESSRVGKVGQFENGVAVALRKLGDARRAAAIVGAAHPQRD